MKEHNFISMTPKYCVNKSSWIFLIQVYLRMIKVSQVSFWEVLSALRIQTQLYNENYFKDGTLQDDMQFKRSNTKCQKWKKSTFRIIQDWQNLALKTFWPTVPISHTHCKLWHRIVGAAVHQEGQTFSIPEVNISLILWTRIQNTFSPPSIERQFSIITLKNALENWKGGTP